MFRHLDRHRQAGFAANPFQFGDMVNALDLWEVEDPGQRREVFRLLSALDSEIQLLRVEDKEEDNGDPPSSDRRKESAGRVSDLQSVRKVHAGPISTRRKRT